MLRVLVTGSRRFTDISLVLNTLSRFGKTNGEFMLIEGGNRKGADGFAAAFAALPCCDTPGNCNCPKVVHKQIKAQWDKYGKAAGAIRNQEMVEMQPHICFAFPTKESIGTIDCMRRCRDAGIPVINLGEVDIDW